MCDWCVRLSMYHFSPLWCNIWATQHIFESGQISIETLCPVQCTVQGEAGGRLSAPNQPSVGWMNFWHVKKCFWLIQETVIHWNSRAHSTSMPLFSLHLHQVTDSNCTKGNFGSASVNEVMLVIKLLTVKVDTLPPFCSALRTSHTVHVLQTIYKCIISQRLFFSRLWHTGEHKSPGSMLLPCWHCFWKANLLQSFQMNLYW